MRGQSGSHGRVIQRARVVNHVLIQTLQTFIVVQAPSLCHPVSISGSGSGYLARDERNGGGGGAVGKPDGIQSGLERRQPAVKGIGIGERPLCRGVRAGALLRIHRHQ